MKINYYVMLALGLATFFTACKKDSGVKISNDFSKNVYVVNNGAFGKANGTIDKFDYTNNKVEANFVKDVGKDYLGAVPNDVLVYGSKIYIVVNQGYSDSENGFLIIVDKNKNQQLKKISLANPRSLTTYGGKVLVSAYGMNQHELMNPITSTVLGRSGFVAVIDTASMNDEKHFQVGRQPEQLAVSGSKLYVANSGGFDSGSPLGYDNRLSVIDLASGNLLKNIIVAKNLYGVKADNSGQIWVSSLGVYNAEPANLFKINTSTDELEKTMGIKVKTFAILGSQLMYVASTGNNTYEYNTIDTKTANVIGQNFIIDGTSKDIKTPNVISIDANSGQFAITDVSDYTSNGNVILYNEKGIKITQFTASASNSSSVAFSN